jgi:uncharacterized protein
MNAGLPGGDTEPWYKQFWPWFIFGLPAIVVVAALATVYIANRHADDLVVDDYYKNGLAINRQLEKIQLARQQGITAVLSIDEGEVTVTTTGPVDSSQLRLLLSHPLEADRDFTVLVPRIAQGSYRTVLPQAIAPHWHWTLELPQAGGWRLDGSVQAADFGNVAID